MNRQQRRHQLERKNLTSPPDIRSNISTEYLHNGEHVILQFSKDLHNIILTERQVDEMCRALQATKEALIVHKAAKAREEGHGNA